MYEWHKKEAPLLGLQGSGGGLGFLAGSGPSLEFPSCTNRPTTNKYMWYTTIGNSNSDNYSLCNGDSHFSTGSTIKGVTTGDPNDPISNTRPGLAAIRFGTPVTVTGVNFGWYHNSGSGYCAGNGFYLLTDDIDGMGPIRSHLNTDTSNKTLSEWKTYYDNQGLSYINTVNYNSGSGCNNPNTYNYPSGSFNYPNVRWVAVTTGRPGYVEDFNGTAGNGAFVITTTGNINM